MRAHPTWIAASCFVSILYLLSLVLTFNVGFERGKRSNEAFENYPAYHTGPIPEMTPAWAIEERAGILYGVSVMVQSGVLREFNVRGGPVPNWPLPQPGLWTELSPGIVKGATK